ncbi:hypothetical protein ACEPAI_8482 [Sanghuangporus weigelae]
MSFLNRSQQKPCAIDTKTYSRQCESDDDDVPPSPTSVASDSSAGSWGKMSQVSRGPPTIRRHQEYYIDSGDVVFVVESQLFKVHSYFFVRESTKFRDMLCMPARSGTMLRGSSDSYPVELRDISAKEFCRFLWVFYNPDYSYEATVNKWASILRLAHLWKFPKVKDLAVREMDKLDIAPVDKAVMAREFQVDPSRRWLETAYAALGAREQPLTKEEGLRLGLDVVLHLAEVRERIRERRRLAAEEQERLRASIPPPPCSVLHEFQRVERDEYFAQRAALAQYVHETRSNGNSRPLSPEGSERSYDSRMAESMYLPPKPHSRDEMNISPTGSSMSPHSLTTPPLSQNLPPSAQLKRSYTEEDVAAVKEVFVM